MKRLSDSFYIYPLIKTVLKELIKLALNVLVLLDLGLADKMSPRHDHLHIAKSLEIVDRVRVGDYKIGALAGLDGAGDIIYMRYLCVSLRCGVECEFIRHAAVLVEIDKLSPHIVVGDERAAGIGSETDGDTVCKALLRAVDYALKDDLAVELRKLGRVADGAIEQRIGKRGRKGRYERRVRSRKGRT